MSHLVPVSELNPYRRQRTRPFDWQITKIMNFIAKLCDSLRESGDPHRSRAQIDTSHALSKAQGHADNAHTLPCTGKIAVANLLFYYALDHLKTKAPY